MSEYNANTYPPIAIGGIGGSGTRLIAQIMKQIGFYIGSDLNQTYDNLWFSLLFRRTEILSATDSEFAELTQTFVNRMTNRDLDEKKIFNLLTKLAESYRLQHTAEWLKCRVTSFLSLDNTPRNERRWGWKEPSTHMVIDRLRSFLPGVKYIHVIRNGLDMAYSANQNQLALWGKIVTGENIEISPYYSLKYWCTVHRRIIPIGKTMGHNFLMLNYEKLCLEPIASLKVLLNFLEIDFHKKDISTLAQFIRTPQSIGRFKQFGLQVFDPTDVSFVQELGFNVNP